MGNCSKRKNAGVIIEHVDIHERDGMERAWRWKSRKAEMQMEKARGERTKRRDETKVTRKQMPNTKECEGRKNAKGTDAKQEGGPPRRHRTW